MKIIHNTLKIKNFAITTLIMQTTFLLSTRTTAMYNPNDNQVTDTQLCNALQNVDHMDQQVDQMIQEARLQHTQGNPYPSLQPQIEQIDLIRHQYELILQILQQDKLQQSEQIQQQNQLSNHQQLLQMLQQSQQFSQQINSNLFQKSLTSNPYQILPLIQQTHYSQPLQTSFTQQPTYQTQEPNHHLSTQNIQQSVQNLIQKLNQLRQEL